MHKILVVEDDVFFRDTICSVLRDNYDVIQAPNGKSACEILLIQEVDLVLSDIQMPGFSGIELLEWTKKNKPIPFILMTGFSTLLETKSAFEMGAQGFIAKPFRVSELLENLDAILKIPEKNKKEEKKNISHYCKVSIDDFVAKPKIDFDVYIKLSETNIIKIAHKNAELPKAQINQYKLKGLKHLYILKEDFHKLVQFNLDLVKIMKDRSDISQDKKVSFLKYTGETLLERTFTDGIDKENLQETNSFVSLCIDSITDSKENFELLSILNNHSDQMYADSIAASMYSVLIANELGFESSATKFKICMAGLFHDIGKKEIDKNILLKPRHLVNKEERQLIESHVIRGFEILSTMKTISSDVSRMVYEHHEDQEGLGYPIRKVKNEQHPLSRIIQCVNVFIESINTTKMSGDPVVVSKIIEHMEKVYGKRIDPQCLSALKKIFNTNLK